MTACLELSKQIDIQLNIFIETNKNNHCITAGKAVNCNGFLMVETKRIYPSFFKDMTYYRS